MLAGLAEVAAGVLLVVPRTAMLGAWLCLFDMVQVFVLNMAYDFGLKQLSFHLILMAGVLVAPDLPRLADVFLRRKVVGAAARRAHSRRARRAPDSAWRPGRSCSPAPICWSCSRT